MVSKKRKQWFGNIPEDGVLIAQANGWALYERPKMSKDGWRTVKLVSTIGRFYKANYHMGWMIEEKRLSRGSEAMLLKQYDPGAYEWVQGVLSNEHFS